MPIQNDRAETVAKLVAWRRETQDKANTIRVPIVMTTFIDGPAQGKTLMLRRAPIYLRVVIKPSGKIDALDQIGDEPEADETCHAYRLTKEPAMCHLNRGKKGSGFYPIAEYQLWTQPEPHQMLTREAWEEWCYKQPIPLWVALKSPEQ